MVRGPKRHAQVTLGRPWTDDALAALRQAEDRFAIAPERGLAVRHLRLPPRARRDLQHVDGSASLFVFVLSGEGAIDDRPLGVWESAFATRDEQLVLDAGPRGVELVVLHVPPTDAEYLPSR
jgi:hypothetical protein